MRPHFNLGNELARVEATRLLGHSIASRYGHEHGALSHRFGEPSNTPPLPLCTRLRSCPFMPARPAAQHDRYHLVSGGSGSVNAVRERFSGW